MLQVLEVERFAVFLDRGWALCVAGPSTSAATGPDASLGPSEYLRTHEESSIQPEQLLGLGSFSEAVNEQQVNSNSPEYTLCVVCFVCLVHEGRRAVLVELSPGRTVGRSHPTPRGTGTL